MKIFNKNTLNKIIPSFILILNSIIERLKELMSIDLISGTPAITTPVITNVVYSANTTNLTNTFSLVVSGNVTHSIAKDSAIIPLLTDPAWVSGNDAGITFNDLGDGDYTAYLYVKDDVSGEISAVEVRVVNYVAPSTAVNPRVTSGSAVDGSDLITINFSDETTSPTNDYSGLTMKLGGTLSPITYLSGDPDWSLFFTHDAGVLNGGEVLTFFYAAAGNDLQEVSGVRLIDSDTTLDPFTVVDVPNAGDPPVMGTLNFPDAIEGQSYNYFIPHTNDADTFFIETGTLPSWLEFNSSLGSFFGNPVAGSQNAVGISVSATHLVNGPSNTSNVDTLNVVAPGAYQPVRTAPFNLGNNGDFAVASSGAVAGDTFDWVLTGSADRNVYDDTHGSVGGGNKACKIRCITGSVHGGGGFIYDRNGNTTLLRVGEGGELWHRHYFYFPSTFPWDSADGKTKFLRQSYLGKAAKLDAWVKNGGNRFLMGNDEVHTVTQFPSTWRRVTSDTDIPRDRWFPVEWYIKFSTDETQGVMRLWQDGALVAEIPQLLTLETSSAITDSAFIMTNYNGQGVNGGPTGPPYNADLWTDATEFASHITPPENVDASGNKMIGPINWVNP